MLYLYIYIYMLYYMHIYVYTYIYYTIYFIEHAQYNHLRPFSLGHRLPLAPVSEPPGWRISKLRWEIRLTGKLAISS